MARERGSAKQAGTKVSSSGDAGALFAAYKNKRQEHLLAATLNVQHEVIKTYVISIGTVSRTVLAAREVFYPAILDNAAAIVVAHNHPSGSSLPSVEDEDVTKTLAAAGKLLGIRVIDHVIVAKDGFYSFKSDGKMEGSKWEDALAAELNILRTPPSFTS
jgi:DNA repair protein RadC